MIRVLDSHTTLMINPRLPTFALVGGPYARSPASLTNLTLELAC